MDRHDDGADAPHYRPQHLAQMGVVRAGQTVPYGSVAPVVREALDKDGVVEAVDLARRENLPLETVGSTLKRAVDGGLAVRVFRGVYARPDVAQAINETIGRLVRR